ncbi:vacuolar protein sorting-associated protein 8 homolog [Achroia grisella]|uniref:vacuolar protein sorting-associated protein 8 homolog n=1 Tax=Achroia grisella TaxID=688607 RepID=UPI0027D274DE|nr:vacuolar protein sorting-associated protein 8 homolog [Achroia grisella]
MDLLKAPSVQSLLDSDLESVESLQYLDIEELDEVEYALPASEAPTLAEILSTNEEEKENNPIKDTEEPSTCSALQLDFLQAVSQQLAQAQERSSAGAVTTLSVGKDGKLTVGTAHGHLISFYEQTLRWVCDANMDRGAVSCLSYNTDSTRLLTGYARGLICQYESVRGILLRKLTLGGEIWGILRVTWAGTSGLALDTGGSVWLMKFSRPLGVRSARTSCLFSGARGEVVAMTARDARILALATLSRVIIVAGGHAAGIRLGGPPDTLPVLEWSETDNRILVCARSTTLQWLSVAVTGSSITLRLVQRVQLKTTPLWLGWLGGSLAIFDSDENLRLWGDDYDKVLDLSQIEPVYASAFFKGLWTDGRVSRAMCSAGVSALGGACVIEGALSLLGRKGIVRVRPRDVLTRAQGLISCGHYLQALRVLCSTQGNAAKELAIQFIQNISEKPHVLNNKIVADETIKLCLKFGLSDELWYNLWENCSGEYAFVEALGDAAVRGELTEAPPSPDSTQALIELLAEFEPGLVERVVASLPLTSIDPHRASVFTREKGLWRGVGAIAAALGGSSGAMRELVKFVDPSCPSADGSGECRCAGAALVVAAADALAGRGAGGRPLPEHAQPSARHDALHALLADDEGGPAPLLALVRHEAAAAARLLEQSAREPPFAGPLAKQNRLRVARALLAYSRDLQNAEGCTEILEFITNQLNTGALPPDQEVIKGAQELATVCSGERGDRAWLALMLRTRPQREQLAALRDAALCRPRALWRLDTLLERHDDVLRDFFLIESPTTRDTDEFFEYLRSRNEANGSLFESYQFEKRCELLRSLVLLRPRAAATLINEDNADVVVAVIDSTRDERVLEFVTCLLDVGLVRGDVAAAHLRRLCTLRPDAVKAFLLKNPGLVRPEEALAIVRETKVEDAKSVCLEATGDPEGALDAILELMRSDLSEEASARLVREAGAVCARAARGAPSAAAAALWARLLRRAPHVPPALLLDAAAWLPAEALLAGAGHEPRAALAMLACAAGRRRGWAAATRAAGREAHEALARALAASRRGVAVRGRCIRCSGRLSSRPPVRTTHCARAAHGSCAHDTACASCGERLPSEVVALPPRSRRRSPSPQEHDLNLVAPPRPDLEGVV